MGARKSSQSDKTVHHFDFSAIEPDQSGDGSWRRT